ncbi:hypothetical protein P152DRAFT_462909 [Eremomyces bilateralis CBS 781.70]|uniref:Uncharacterized protein n=1 Tax=Eremomyces bilateralis CBS 781.70 TaxID=1392243 RepID=A0A6G1FQY8_9PEZI|nr:uncharacterized protein P152DRAFT_462909 [Eremomyces bilateralis CBS 781.70]KAF1808099.1 hypothetical protein P152DRAFT_462909 [Eremomyces bilateralis CBS 781.70]
MDRLLPSLSYSSTSMTATVCVSLRYQGSVGKVSGADRKLQNLTSAETASDARPAVTTKRSRRRHVYS